MGVDKELDRRNSPPSDPATGNSARKFGLVKQSQSMTDRGKEKGKQLGMKLAPTRSSSRLLQVGPIDNREVDLSKSGEDSEGTLEGSESRFGSVKLEGEARNQELLLLQDTWTPGTVRDTATQVRIQVTRLAEENSQLRMAREIEQTSIEKMMQ